MTNGEGIAFTSVSITTLLLSSGCFFSPPECELCADPEDDICIPSEGLGPPPDRCGLFVSSAAEPGGDGTRARPLRSLAEALAAVAPGKGVYACAEVFREAVTVPSGVRLYGGLDCSNGFWYVPRGPRTEIAPPLGPVAMRLSPGDAETRVIDVNVLAPNATEAGGSSIAALVDHAVVVFVRANLVAGDAAPGEPGAEIDAQALAGEPGFSGLDACGAGVLPGGGAGVSACEDNVSSGGHGGHGSVSHGADGLDGAPGGLTNHGSGQPEGDLAALCTDGDDGADGADGAPGRGGGSAGRIGVHGFSGASGQDGMPGKVAQGGGGGGGARGGLGVWACPGPAAGGASGGGGGAGGCGGRGGRGGGAGGASTALVSLGPSWLSFEDAALLSGRGGEGGRGGPGQPGGQGGFGAPGGVAPPALFPACRGGDGGRGGAGGPGGGGAGGPSIGVAHTNPLPFLSGVNVWVGEPGKGGEGTGDTGRGSAGMSASTLEMGP